MTAIYIFILLLVSWCGAMYPRIIGNKKRLLPDVGTVYMSDDVPMKIKFTGNAFRILGYSSKPETRGGERAHASQPSRGKRRCAEETRVQELLEVCK